MFLGPRANDSPQPKILMKIFLLISLSHGRCSRHLGVPPLPRVWESPHHEIQLFSIVVVCIMPGKFTVTTFKSRFSRCLNSLESFTRADSTPKWRILAFVRKANWICSITLYMIRFALSLTFTWTICLLGANVHGFATTNKENCFPYLGNVIINNMANEF
jgi:hypothetical protein